MMSMMLTGKNFVRAFGKKMKDGVVPEKNII